MLIIQEDQGSSGTDSLGLYWEVLYLLYTIGLFSEPFSSWLNIAPNDLLPLEKMDCSCSFASLDFSKIHCFSISKLEPPFAYVSLRKGMGAPVLTGSLGS